MEPLTIDEYRKFILLKMKRDADVISEKLHIDEVIDWSDPEPIIREDLLDLVDEANAKMPHPLLHKKAWKRYGHLRWLMDLDLRDPLLVSKDPLSLNHGDETSEEQDDHAL